MEALTVGVIHQALLADLVGLAKLWDIPDDELGLEVTEEGALTPIPIESGDSSTISLGRIREEAKKQYPVGSELDLVVNILSPDNGESEVRLLTVEKSLLPAERSRLWTFRWWTFTDNYKDRMH